MNPCSDVQFMRGTHGRGKEARKFRFGAHVHFSAPRHREKKFGEFGSGHMRPFQRAKASGKRSSGRHMSGEPQSLSLSLSLSLWREKHFSGSTISGGVRFSVSVSVSGRFPARRRFSIGIPDVSGRNSGCLPPEPRPAEPPGTIPISCHFRIGFPTWQVRIPIQKCHEVRILIWWSPWSPWDQSRNWVPEGAVLAPEDSYIPTFLQYPQSFTFLHS